MMRCSFNLFPFCLFAFFLFILVFPFYELEFWEDMVKGPCDRGSLRDGVAKLRNAITIDFYFQMCYDDHPLCGFIGKVKDESWIVNEDGPKYYPFKYVQSDAFYSGNQVIGIRALSDPNHVVDMTKNVEIWVKIHLFYLLGGDLCI